MKTTVNFSTFQTAFEQLRPNNFSYEGLTALFDYFEQYEAETDEELELDVIAICCEYSEYTLHDIARDYGYMDSFDLADDEKLTLEKALSFLDDNTQVVGVTGQGTIVFRQF